MGSELERLADRARDEAARAASLAEARAERKRLARRAYEDKLVRESLSTSYLAPIIAVVGFATFGCLAFFVAKTGLPLSVRRILVVVSFVLAFASFGSLALYPRWGSAREIRWMMARPFEVQLAGYIAALGLERASGRPEVRVSFDKAPTPHERETITLGVEQSSWYGSPTCRPQKLHASSPSLQHASAIPASAICSKNRAYPPPSVLAQLKCIRCTDPFWC